MSEEGIDYFVIPSEDGHLSEYVTPSDRRLLWISNFSGSAGAAIVSKRSAYLFVDSRYWIQAKNEIDTNWNIYRVGTPELRSWLEWAITCPRGSKIAIDSRMIRHEQGIGLYKGLYDRGSKLHFPRQNLIDLIWEYRPKKPSDPVNLHLVQYTGKDTKDKLAEIRKRIRKMDVAYQPNTNAPSIERNTSSNKIAAILISDMHSIAYTLNLYGSDVAFHSVFMAYLIVGVEGITTLFIQTEKISKIEGALSEDGISVREYGEIWTYLRQKQWGDGKIIIHPNTPYAASLILGSHSYVVLPSFIDEMRALKNEVEIEGLRNSYIRDGVAIVRWFAWLESKLTEGYEVTEFEASEMLNNFRQGDKAQMYLGPGSANIVASGSNAAMPLYNPTRLEASLISRNSPFLVDIKSRYLDGMCTVARTTHFGSPTTEQAESFVHVLQGHLAIDTAAFPPGTTCAQLGVLASKTLWRDGQNHHSFLSFHEPSDSLTSSTPLQPGHVIINEPGFYKDGEFGIRLGSAFVVRKVRGAITNGLYGLERLTQVPIQTKMIRWSMLSKEEQRWIKDHNANVLKVLEPHLLEDKTALKWLRRECRMGLVDAIKGFAKLAID
ncbi:hypothetical protein M408DRAFT_17397 [Serendipita vermifera MAFF 305830]|uniref:Creatinase N-terminal domain-containing protein n=1 Tax=Serendipita vermifera MAFF 305830 TaxID=933852 RepID=A0A0C2WFS2_SERVB|nr:hypothetical protein M408DRAFT_17397 [Serendipita vermifera MAFF 305830]